jgi:hypothetical protein
VTSADVQRVALIALGRVSLRDAATAKRSVAIFVACLDPSVDAGARNNAMVALCDLCMRLTNGQTFCYFSFSSLFNFKLWRFLFYPPLSSA